MPSFALGPLSNRPPEYQKQNSLVVDEHGRLRFAALSRRILALPLETLAEIFLHSLPYDEFIIADLSSAPLVLCQVCQRWREVALSTPRLWSSLALEMQLAKKRKGYVELYQDWLSRARSTPLSLALLDADDDDAAPGNVIPLLQTVARLSPQWQNVDVDLGVAVARFLKFSSGKHCIDPVFPLLENLSIAGHTTTALSDLSISFCNAPKLRAIVAPVYHTVRAMRFPWAQITTVRTGDILLGHCLEILGNAPRLVSCTFEVRDDGSALPTSIISLPDLESLTLAGMLVLDAGRIPLAVLACIQTPALKNLTLQFSYFYGSHAWNQPWDITPFLSFLSRSSASNRPPSVVHLRLEPLRIVDRATLFAQLTGVPDFLPKLETLDLFSSIHTGVTLVDPALIVKMLCWRWAGVGITRLRSFQMAQTPSLVGLETTTTDDPECRRLEAEGMILYCGVERETFRSSVGLQPF
ncbi:hypothetical protein C8R46DRAFT_1227834 [Mycena filopes]|nr:hypothetical protein C8R46DRAFT_1227834 [Mycena filopes]